MCSEESLEHREYGYVEEIGHSLNHAPDIKTLRWSLIEGYIGNYISLHLPPHPRRPRTAQILRFLGSPED